MYVAKILGLSFCLALLSLPIELTTSESCFDACIIHPRTRVQNPSVGKSRFCARVFSRLKYFGTKADGLISFREDRHKDRHDIVVTL